MNKGTIVISIVLSFFFYSLSSGAASAQTPEVTESSVEADTLKLFRGERKPTKAETKHDRRPATTSNVERLKQKANRAIDRRLKALQHLTTSLNRVKKITPEQKEKLKTQLQAEISKLNELKAKISTETNPQTIRTYTQSLGKSHPGFALYNAKLQIIIKADKLLASIEKSNTLADKLEVKLKEAKAGGKDVTALQSSLTELRKHLADAKTKATNAIDTVLPLTTEGYPANKTELKKGRDLVRAAHQDLVKALTAAKKIVQELRKDKLTPTPHTSTTPSPSSLTPTSAPSVTPVPTI